MKNCQVYKFGGTSVASPETIKQVAKIISDSNKQTIVIVSAMGGLTDKLLYSAEEAAKGKLQGSEAVKMEFVLRHEEVVNKLIKNPTIKSSLKNQINETANQFFEICKSLAILREHTPRILDVTVARGERMLAKILSAVLKDKSIKTTYLDATEVIFSSIQGGIPTPDFAKCKKAAQSIIPCLFNENDIIIIPGFISTGPNSEILTLGRSGSDYSATIIANAVEAESVTLFKEVDGLLTSDPRIVKKARVIPEIHYREATELAYYGAKVLHPKTITPLLEKKIPLIIKNSFNPNFPGTRISQKDSDTAYPVKALTAYPAQALITVKGTGMLGVPGIAAKTFATMAQANISVSVISQASSEASICFTVPEKSAKESIKLLEETFKLELHHKHISCIEKQSNLAVVAIVGMGMRGVPGIAARTFSSLSKKNVNIVSIAQGSSELNISFVIEEKDMEKALNALHDEYQLNKLKSLPERVGREIELSIFGFGQIGRTLVKQIISQKDFYKDSYQLSCHFTGIADKSGIIIEEHGFSNENLKKFIRLKEEKKSLIQNTSPITFDYIHKQTNENLFQLPNHRGIFVDLTAEETAPIIIDALKNKHNVVLANKKPLAVDQEIYDEIINTAKENDVSLRYEATVGAGLPILDTITKLESSGDSIKSILGCLSGTLGFLMTRMEDGVLFSKAVEEAFRGGYTEPDPREDLSGMDVARKALILSRRIGKKMNMADIKIEALYTEELSDDNPEKFLKNLQKLDESFKEKILKAAENNNVLRYVARIDNDNVSVGIEEIPKQAPLGQLRGTDNQITIKTERYENNPLIVTGPGAGAEVTAAGVLNDVIAIALSDNNLN